MGAMAYQITSLTIVYSTVYSGADERNSSASLAFVRGIHWWPVNSLHKWPATRKRFHLMTSSCEKLVFSLACCLLFQTISPQFYFETRAHSKTLWFRHLIPYKTRYHIMDMMKTGNVYRVSLLWLRRQPTFLANVRVWPLRSYLSSLCLNNRESRI